MLSRGRKRKKLIVVTVLQVNLPRGYGYVEFKTRADAEKALLYMDGVCINYPMKQKTLL